MDLSLVRIVAAAPGVILDKADGNDDRSCAMSGAAWNAVYVRHADGSVIWYGHMKKGSLTAKPVGSPVAAGEFLGIVGSSGNSTGPHLHFEVHGPAGQVHRAALRRLPGGAVVVAGPAPLLRLGDQRPPDPFAALPCPAHLSVAETPNANDVFAPGARAYFAAYYRDQLAGQVTEFTVRRPDGTVYTSWTSIVARTALRGELLVLVRSTCRRRPWGPGPSKPGTRGRPTRIPSRSGASGRW